METITIGQEPAASERHNRHGRWLWMVAGVLLALVVWVVIEDRTGEGGSPTVTFDGEQSVYTGPSTVTVGDDGRWTARFVNDTDEHVYWNLAMLDDHPPLKVYRSEMTRWFLTDTGWTERPPYVVHLKQGRLPPEQTVEVSVDMTGTVALDVVDAFGWRWYTAGFVEVETGSD